MMIPKTHIMTVNSTRLRQIRSRYLGADRLVAVCSRRAEARLTIWIAGGEPSLRQATISKLISTPSRTSMRVPYWTKLSRITNYIKITRLQESNQMFNRTKIYWIISIIKICATVISHSIKMIAVTVPTIQIANTTTQIVTTSCRGPSCNVLILIQS